MSEQGQVTVRGRFAPGVVVALVRPVDVGALRAGEGATLDRKRVGSDGSVSFDGLEVGAAYFVTGHSDGHFVEARMVASTGDDGVVQQPVGNAATRTAGGAALHTPVVADGSVIRSPVAVDPGPGTAPADPDAVKPKRVRPSRAKTSTRSGSATSKAAVRSSTSSKGKK